MFDSCRIFSGGLVCCHLEKVGTIIIMRLNIQQGWGLNGGKLTLVGMLYCFFKPLDWQLMSNNPLKLTSKGYLWTNQMKAVKNDVSLSIYNLINMLLKALRRSFFNNNCLLLFAL